MEKLNALKQQKWVVAVSGGSDSMALLHMCIQAGVQVVIAHVNYQKRETAKRDMEGVLAFAQKYQIPCFVMEVEKYKEKTNFQSQARELRYRFFAQIVKENDCEGVLVAHHMDDVLETYIMQKRSHRTPTQYGIKADVELFGVRVKRVLLDQSKAALKSYCIENDVPYYEDESNFSDAYERNRIRHSIIEKLNAKEKERLYDEMVSANKKWNEIKKEAQCFLSQYEDAVSLDSFLQLHKEVQYTVLRMFIESKIEDIVLTKKALNDMILMLKNHKNTNAMHTIKERIALCKEYGYIRVEKLENEEFSYVLEKLEWLKTPYFEIAKEGKKIEGVYVEANDFPLTIRNAKEGDCIQLRIGTKKVNRFFIDRKIPHKERMKWPVVENKDGNVIFVSGIGCDIYHYSNNYSFFVLK